MKGGVIAYKVQKKRGAYSGLLNKYGWAAALPYEFVRGIVSTEPSVMYTRRQELLLQFLTNSSCSLLSKKYL